jgi:hypothetical protein
MVVKDVLTAEQRLAQLRDHLAFLPTLESMLASEPGAAIRRARVDASCPTCVYLEEITTSRQSRARLVQDFSSGSYRFDLAAHRPIRGVNRQRTEQIGGFILRKRPPD